MLHKTWPRLKPIHLIRLKPVWQRFRYVRLKKSYAGVWVVLQYICSPLEFLPQYFNAVLVHNTTKVMGGFKWILNAYQMPIITNSPRPVFRSLAVMRRVQWWVKKFIRKPWFEWSTLTKLLTWKNKIKTHNWV